MISAYHYNLNFLIRQLCQELIKKADRLSGRNRPVIDISCNNQRINFILRCQRNKLIQNQLLFLQHGKIIDHLADMQVRNV